LFWVTNAILVSKRAEFDADNISDKKVPKNHAKRGCKSYLNEKVMEKFRFNFFYLFAKVLRLYCIYFLMTFCMTWLILALFQTSKNEMAQNYQKLL
jgi:hypothetical protein